MGSSFSVVDGHRRDVDMDVDKDMALNIGIAAKRHGWICWRIPFVFLLHEKDYLYFCRRFLSYSTNDTIPIVFTPGLKPLQLL